jgi:hypothetical protein
MLIFQFANCTRTGSKSLVPLSARSISKSSVGVGPWLGVFVRFSSLVTLVVDENYKPFEHVNPGFINHGLLN